MRYWPILLLALFLATDVTFIGLDLAYRVGLTHDSKFEILNERGYAEVFQHVKLYWIVLALSWITFNRRQPVYGVGAMLFLYLMLDDSLEIHENVGRWMAATYDLPSALGLRGQDFGELATYATAGAVHLAIGWIAYRRSDDLARAATRYAMLGLLALAVFGVGVDMFAIALERHLPWTHAPLGILEDGGEMVVVSVIACYVLSFLGEIQDRHSTPEPAGHDVTSG